jgi:hypothetical protein
MSRRPTNERVRFRYVVMPCCKTQLCWVNPRLPNYCPECGTRVYIQLKSGEGVLIDAPAWLRVEKT